MAINVVDLEKRAERYAEVKDMYADKNISHESVELLPEPERSSLTVCIEEIVAEARKPLPWAIEKTLINDTLNIIYGAPKEFKTFIAIDMALSQATGLPFLATYKVLKQGLVIYCAGEGIAGIGQRVLAWCIERGIKDVNSETVPFRRTKGAIQICDGGASQLASEIDRILSETGIPLAGIYIDTLARNFGSGDENSTKDMNTFVTQCDMHLKSRFNVPVVIVHHSGHSESSRPRGAMALMGAADGMTKVSFDFPKVTYKPDFMKDAETPPSHVLEVEKISLGYADQFGVPVSSLVLRMTDETPGKSGISLSEDARLALSLVLNEEKDFEEWHKEWLKVAVNLPSKKGVNKGKNRNNNGLRVAWNRVVEKLETESMIIVHRNNDIKALSVELPRDTEV